MLKSDQNKLIEHLLRIELDNIAVQQKLIKGEPPEISDELLKKAVGLIDELSLETDPLIRRNIVLISAILWSYKKPEWTGLKDFLIKIFSRIGFPPTCIMLDLEYDHQSAAFSAMESYIDELAVTCYHLTKEIKVKNTTYLLTDFQYRTWQAISKNKILGISAPTSAGKSFIIALKAIELLLKTDGIIVYIVPNLSLVNQVTVDFRLLLKKHGLDDYETLNTFIEDAEHTNKKIFILTQEKAIGAFTHQAEPFKRLRLLVIDEIQNIEKVSEEDEQRSKILYDLINEFQQNSEADHIILAGPRIEKIGALGKELFGKEAQEEEAQSSPVGNITYSIQKTGNKSFLRQHNSITSRPLSVEISEDVSIPNGILYDENIHKFICNFIINLGNTSKNLIFSPKPAQAVKTALYISKNIPAQDKDLKVDSLINYISSTVHSQYDLVTTLNANVAFHHGQMPLHARRVVERAIAEKLINNVVCTTTLMQGVNLPAQNVIIRNPHLFIRRPKKGEVAPKLSDYEIANLRGRAGRLMKDLMGRTFILEEDKFEHAEEQNLFPEATKQLKTGYGEVFNKYKTEILTALREKESAKEENKEYSFLTTYIRQKALKHRDKLRDNLKRVGINLTTQEEQSVLSTLSQITIPIEICFKNRYWDPISLNKLYTAHLEAPFDLPNSVNSSDIAKKIIASVEKLRPLVPFYSQKYFAFENTPKAKVLDSICFLAQHWLKEKPLSEILKSNYYAGDDVNEKINKTISQLQKDISYGLPMLLQPIYDIALPDSSFLRSLELGAFHPVTRMLIERTIPRETAISLQKRYLSDLSDSTLNLNSVITQRLRDRYDELDYWVQVQLQSVL